MKNIRKRVADLPGTGVDAPHGRVVVYRPPEQVQVVCERLTKVFGLVSVSPAQVTAREIEELQTSRWILLKSASPLDQTGVLCRQGETVG